MNDPSFKFKKPDYPSWQELTMVPVGLKGEFNLPKGEKDTYEVSLWLTNYSQGLCVSNNLHIDQPNPEPDSYLHIRLDTSDPKTTITKLKLDFNNGIQAILQSNKSGRLSQIIIDLESNNFKDSIDKAYSTIMPFLSHWSFLLDIPMIIVALKAKMKKTGSFRFFALTDGKTRMWPIDTNTQNIVFSKLESLSLLSLYREAINLAISPFYQVFLLHRIREGIYKKIRLIKSDKKSEIIPIDSIEVLKEFCGKEFSYIHNQIEEKLRNNLAHFNLTKSGLLKQTSDRFNNFYECITKWLPVSFFITKAMIKTELK